MTVATMQKEVTALRKEIAAQTVLLNERLPAPVVDSGQVEFISTWPNLGPLRTDPGVGESIDKIWWIEGSASDRVTVIAGGRTGKNAVRLHTEPGDSALAGSGQSERADMALSKWSRGVLDLDYWGFNGKEQWWEHSVLFPDDYVPAPWNVIFNFHDDRNLGGQANFHLFAGANGLTFRGHAGPEVVNSGAGNQYSYGGEIISPLVRNTWIDFVYYVKWSWGGDGFFKAWVNGALKLDHSGPTLYNGFGVFLKLSNYHPAIGQPSSVIHSRVVRGTTWQSVSLTPLQGVTA